MVLAHLEPRVLLLLVRLPTSGHLDLTSLPDGIGVGAGESDMHVTPLVGIYGGGIVYAIGYVVAKI